MNDNPFYTKNGCLVRDSQPWEINEFGFNNLAMGDFGFHNAEESVKLNTTTYLDICGLMLYKRMRWPAWMGYGKEKHIAKTWLGFKLSHLKWKIAGWAYDEGEEIPFTRLYRPRHIMTRDPYTAYFYACILLDKKEKIYGIRPPKRLYTPTFYAWVKYIKTGKGADRYFRLEQRAMKDPFKKDFALHLCDLRLKTYYKIRYGTNGRTKNF